MMQSWRDVVWCTRTRHGTVSIHGNFRDCVAEHSFRAELQLSAAGAFVFMLEAVRPLSNLLDQS